MKDVNSPLHLLRLNIIFIIYYAKLFGLRHHHYAWSCNFLDDGESRKAL